MARQIATEPARLGVCVTEVLDDVARLSPGEIGQRVSIACGAHPVIAFWSSVDEALTIARYIEEWEWPAMEAAS